MVRTPAIVHLIGYPSVGKYTVAKELARLANDEGDPDRRIVLVDNHLTSNVIFAVLDVDGVRPVQPVVWERVDEVREVLSRTIETLSPPDWSFVFTNVVLADKPEDRRTVDRVRRIAELRGHPYVPVVLTCATDEVARRVPVPGRAARHKWIDPAGVVGLIESAPLLDMDPWHALQLDTTSAPPEATARRILDHLEVLGTSSEA